MDSFAATGRPAAPRALSSKLPSASVAVGWKVRVCEQLQIAGVDVWQVPDDRELRSAGKSLSIGAPPFCRACISSGLPAVITASQGPLAAQLIPFRYWVDELAIPAGSTSLIERALTELGGIRTGGPRRAAGDMCQAGSTAFPESPQPAIVASHRDPQGATDAVAMALDGRTAPSADGASLHQASSSSSGDGEPARACPCPQHPQHPQHSQHRPAHSGNVRQLGCNNVASWDLLWSIGKYASQAASLVSSRQLVNTLPGLSCLGRKAHLTQALVTAFGQSAAFAILPLTFLLPKELPAWKQHCRDHELSHHAGDGGDGGGGLWMLKSEDDRGQGLELLPAAEAFKAAVLPRVGRKYKHFCVAQLYIVNPHLVEGRKYHLRVWVLVTGVRPLRAYVHRNGLALFSNVSYDVKGFRGFGPDGVGRGHVTNYARNRDGMVLSFEQLEARLGQGWWGHLWTQAVWASAMVVSAGLGKVVQGVQRYGMPDDTGFELLGLDFMADAGRKLWLLEVNNMPVMGVSHRDPGVEGVIYEQKWGMVRDMMRMMVGRVGGRRGWREEMELAGGFVPLMGWFGRDVHGRESEAGNAVVWSQEDLALRGEIGLSV